MDATTARERLAVMVAFDSEPALAAEDLDALVSLAARADTDGRAPSDAAWAGVYDLNAAAAEGWRWKAAKVASKFDVSTDGQTLSRSQIVAHCRQMADDYQRRVVQHVPVYGTLSTPYTRAQEV